MLKVPAKKSPMGLFKMPAPSPADAPLPMRMVAVLVARAAKLAFYACRNALLDGFDVYGVGAGKQRRKRKAGIAGLVGVGDIAAIATVVHLSRVLIAEVVRTGVSDLSADAAGSGRAEKSPAGLVGAVVLAEIDADEKLRLALLYGNQGKLGWGDNFEVVMAWAGRCFFCWERQQQRIKANANKPNTSAYSSGSGMTEPYTRMRRP